MISTLILVSTKTIDSTGGGTKIKPIPRQPSTYYRWMIVFLLLFRQLLSVRYTNRGVY